MVGFMTLSSEAQEVLRPQTGERQWHRILKALHGVQPGGGMPAGGPGTGLCSDSCSAPAWCW